MLMTVSPGGGGLKCKATKTCRRLGNYMVFTPLKGEKSAPPPMMSRLTETPCRKHLELCLKRLSKGKGNA